MANPTLLILPGDGIGPEVMAEVRHVIDWLADKRGIRFDVSEDLVGGAAYDVHGVPLSDATMERRWQWMRCCWVRWAGRNTTTSISA